MSTDVQVGLKKDTHQDPTLLKRRLQVEKGGGLPSTTMVS